MIIAKNKKIKGFALIEVLFSLGMFVAGVIAVVSLMNQEISKSIDRRNEVIAGQLAQEGIELVRNIRDNNWLASPFVSSFDHISNTTTGTINYGESSIATGRAYNIYLNGGFYDYNSGGAGTVFKRRIIIGDGDNSNEKKIVSMATWGGSDSNNILDEAHCDVISKCFSTEVILNGEWGK